MHIRALGALLALLLSGGAQAVALIECAPSGGHACCQKAQSGTPDLRPDVPVCCRASSAPVQSGEPRLAPASQASTAAVPVAACPAPLQAAPLRHEAPQLDPPVLLSPVLANCALLI